MKADDKRVNLQEIAENITENIETRMHETEYRSKVNNI